MTCDGDFLASKCRVWLIVAYPESMPSDWVDLIDSWAVPVWVSPIHDSDVDSDGKIKKAHFHIVVRFDGPTTYNVAVSLANLLNVNHAVPAVSFKGALRYLCHDGNNRKHQYDHDDILLFNGASMDDMLDDDDKIVSSLKSVIDLISDFSITTFCELVNVALSKKPDCVPFIVSHAYLCSCYLNSASFSCRGGD